MNNYFFLFLLAFLSLDWTNASAQTQANIFASELKVSDITAENDVSFSYTLNADATSVIIEVSNGETFEITNAGDLTKGSHVVTKRLTVPKIVVR